jgi:hypothetical protein
MNKKLYAFAAVLISAALFLSGCASVNVSVTPNPSPNVGKASTASEIVKATDAKIANDSMLADWFDNKGTKVATIGYWAKSPYILDGFVETVGLADGPSYVMKTLGASPLRDSGNSNLIWLSAAELLKFNAGEKHDTSTIVYGSKAKRNEGEWTGSGDLILGTKDTIDGNKFTRVITWDSTDKVKPTTTVNLTLNPDDSVASVDVVYSWKYKLEDIPYVSYELNGDYPKAVFTYGNNVVEPAFNNALQSLKYDAYGNQLTPASFEGLKAEMKAWRASFMRGTTEGIRIQGGASYNSVTKIAKAGDYSGTGPDLINNYILTLADVFDHTDFGTMLMFDKFEVTGDKIIMSSSVVDSEGVNPTVTLTIQNGVITQMDSSSNANTGEAAASKVIIYSNK